MWARRYQVWSRDQYEYCGLDMVGVLLGINAFVFAGWWLAPPRFMEDHFASSLRNLDEGRWWTLITPAFSHQSVVHLMFNSLALWDLGKNVMFVLGPSRVLLFYLAAGLVANVSHLAYATEIRPRIMAPNTHHFQIYKIFGAEQGAVGMSGSVMGLLVLEAALFPETVIPWLRAPVVVGVLVAAELLLALSAPESRIAHSSHLGGALTGLIYALCLRRRFGRR